MSEYTFLHLLCLALCAFGSLEIDVGTIYFGGLDGVWSEMKFLGGQCADIRGQL